MSDKYVNQSNATKMLTNVKNYVDSELDLKQDVINDLSTIRSNASAGKSASDTIATYGDIVTHNTNEFATASQGAKADTAVQPSQLGALASQDTVDYNTQVTNKPTIPTVNNSTITITQGGVTKGSFTLNQSTSETIAVDVGGAIPLYSTTGQNTDGAMTQKATTNELNKKIEFTEVGNPTSPVALAIPSNPNLLINGDFRINQRGQSTYTGSGTRLYTVDRWAITSSASVNVSDKLSVSFGGQYQVIEQKIEDYEKLKGKTLTLSCKILNTTIGSGGLYLRYNSGDLNGSTQITSDGIYKLTFTLSSDATQLAIQIFSGTGSSQQYNFDLEYMKLEIGEVVTPFSPRHYEEELALCQRYYQVIKKESGSTNLNLTLARNTTNARIFVNLIQTLRTSPTIKNSDCVLFNVKSNTYTVVGNNSLTMTCLSNNQIVLNFATSGLTAGDVNFISDTNGNAKIELDAEIY